MCSYASNVFHRISSGSNHVKFNISSYDGIYRVDEHAHLFHIDEILERRLAATLLCFGFAVNTCAPRSLDYSNYRNTDLRICHVCRGKSVALVMLAGADSLL